MFGFRLRFFYAVSIIVWFLDCGEAEKKCPPTSSLYSTNKTPACDLHCQNRYGGVNLPGEGMVPMTHGECFLLTCWCVAHEKLRLSRSEKVSFLASGFVGRKRKYAEKLKQRRGLTPTPGTGYPSPYPIASPAATFPGLYGPRQDGQFIRAEDFKQNVAYMNRPGTPPYGNYGPPPPPGQYPPSSPNLVAGPQAYPPHQGYGQPYAAQPNLYNSNQGYNHKQKPYFLSESREPCRHKKGAAADASCDYHCQGKHGSVTIRDSTYPGKTYYQPIASGRCVKSILRKCKCTVSSYFLPQLHASDRFWYHLNRDSVVKKIRALYGQPSGTFRPS